MGKRRNEMEAERRGGGGGYVVRIRDERRIGGGCVG